MRLTIEPGEASGPTIGGPSDPLSVSLDSLGNIGHPGMGTEGYVVLRIAYRA